MIGDRRRRRPADSSNSLATSDAHQPIREIRRCIDSIQDCSDRELSRMAERVREGGTRTSRNSLSDPNLLGTSLVAEAIRRTTGLQYYDVQLHAGLVVAAGCIAEMATGEGKTIVAAIPTVLSVLNRQQVHVATTNAYLAQRDHNQLQAAFELLGLTSGVLEPGQSEAVKRRVYQSDIVYAPGYELGFDYLRDRLKLRSDSKPILGEQLLRSLRGLYAVTDPLIQQRHDRLIIDEIDSVLLDEAMTPLIISAPVSGPPPDESIYRLAQQVASDLRMGVDYELDAAGRTVQLTDTGHQRIEARRPDRTIGRLRRRWDHYVHNALRAECVLRRDVDYVIADGEVRIVDPQTGRIFAERSWQDGLHQAVEANEQLSITAENEATARISRQRYALIYQHLSGMSGTAVEAEEEFQSLYGLPVTPIPRHRPLQRTELPLRGFADAAARNRAIVEDVRNRQQRRQPVLIGTRTIEQSEQLAELLTAAGLEHLVLNGKQDADEAEIIALAGTPGRVTIATNMAGRGTDIRLATASREAGGLHVIATEPHPFRRIDRQLLGRCARQGDPGSCQIFVTSEDELLARFDSPLAVQLSRRANSNGEVMDFDRGMIERLQRQAERSAREQRRQLRQQDSWLQDVLQTLARDTTEPELAR